MNNSINLNDLRPEELEPRLELQIICFGLPTNNGGDGTGGNLGFGGVDNGGTGTGDGIF